MDKELLKRIEREALKIVLNKLQKDGIYELKRPVAGMKAKMLHRLFDVEVTVVDAYTIKINQ